jgi:DNA-directed RNA polymerase subunit L
MMCGTTPTHYFKLPFNVDTISKIRILYSQDNKIVFVKNTEDCTLENNLVTTKLTQENTLAFDYRKPIEVQVRVLDVNGDSLVSTIKVIRAGRCLDNEVIL